MQAEERSTKAIALARNLVWLRYLRIGDPVVPTELIMPRAQHLRFSMFPEIPLIQRRDWWEAFTGQSPDVDETHKREAQIRQTGPYRNGSLTVTAHAVKVDVVYQMGFGVSDVPDLDPTIGDFETELRAFAADLLSWAPALEVASLRFALGGAAWAPAQSSIDAYQHLAGQLRSLSVRPGEMKDLIYRVNWPVESNVPSIGSINRLTTFSVVDLAIHNLQSSGSSAVVHRYYSSMEFDINTQADRSAAIEGNLVSGVINEFVELASKNASVGECA